VAIFPGKPELVIIDKKGKYVLPAFTLLTQFLTLRPWHPTFWTQNSNGTNSSGLPWGRLPCLWCQYPPKIL